MHFGMQTPSGAPALPELAALESAPLPGVACLLRTQFRRWAPPAGLAEAAAKGLMGRGREGGRMESETGKLAASRHNGNGAR
jgi:hypothetical protein